MASQSAANATQQTGNYAPGSLAASPRRHAGGVRRRDESPEAFRNRMDTQAYLHGQAPQGMPPMAAGGVQPPMQTRQDRIIAARMDGTFGSKRDTFNQANAGKLAMDEAGNINPITAAPAPATPSPPTAPATANSVPPVNTVTPPTPKLPAGGSTPMMKPVGKIDGRPASLVLEGMKSAPTPQSPPAPQSTGLRPPITRTASGELVQPGTPMNPNARWQKPGAPVTQSVTPPVTRNAPVTPTVTPKSVTPKRVTPLSPQQEKQFTALGQAHQLSQASQGPMPRVSTTSAMPAKFVAPDGGFSPEFHRQFDPVPTTQQPAVAPATPPAVPPAKVTPPARLNAAQAQAVKNPQGLSARMNPPGVQPVPLSQDPIAKPVIAGLNAIGQAVSAGGGMVSTALKSQAAKNPTGLAAKLGRLTGVVPPAFALLK